MAPVSCSAPRSSEPKRNLRAHTQHPAVSTAGWHDTSEWVKGMVLWASALQMLMHKYPRASRAQLGDLDESTCFTWLMCCGEHHVR